MGADRLWPVVPDLFELVLQFEQALVARFLRSRQITETLDRFLQSDLLGAIDILRGRLIFAGRFRLYHLCSDRCSTSQQPHHQQQLQSNAMRDRSLGVHEAAFYPSKIDARILLCGGHLGEIPGDGDDGDHQDNSQ